MEVYHFLFIISFVLFIKSFLNRSKSNKLPPGPIGLPIVGSLPQLGARPHESLYNMAKIHGPLMTLRLGFVTTVVASSSESAKEILKKHDETISDRFIPDVVTVQPNLESTLAWVSGNSTWRNRRRICSNQMFSVQGLDMLQHLRHEKVQQLVTHIKEKYALSRKPVDIGQVAFATTLNLISNTMFSIDMVDPKFETAQEFKELVWSMMEDIGKPNLSDYFTVLRRYDLQGMKRHITKSYKRLYEIFDDLINKRLEARARGSLNKTGDFLDVLLDQSEEDGSDFNRHTIKPLFVDLFLAGSDTSAITTEWAMAELLRDPKLLKKARQELMEVIGKKRSMQESDIKQLPYLQAIVKETMRLHPAAPLLLPYQAKYDAETFGYTIPKGTQVLVNAWAIGRDPKDWNEPLSFCPERFIDSKIDYRGNNFEYIPFGAGRRICPGWPLAVRMVHLMIGSLIHSFEWELPDEVAPQTLNMQEQFGITLRKATPLYAIPKV